MEDVIEMENTPTVPNNELEQRYIRYKDVIKELTIMNDIFMRNVFKKRECIEHVLRIIMEMKNLQVLDYTVQKDYKNLQGRSAILDCGARDDVNNQYNVEIQQDTEGASPKRARYHSGLLDMNTLNPGQNFEELTDSYVIFITKDDVRGNGLPIYHADRAVSYTHLNLILPEWTQPDDAYQQLVDKAQAAGVNVQKGRKGEQIALGKASLRFLSPDRGTAGTDANEDGMVVELTYGGFEGLFTGDIGTETEKKLLPELEDVDFRCV